MGHWMSIDKILRGIQFLHLYDTHYYYRLLTWPHMSVKINLNVKKTKRVYNGKSSNMTCLFHVRSGQVAKMTGQMPLTEHIYDYFVCNESRHFGPFSEKITFRHMFLKVQVSRSLMDKMIRIKFMQPSFYSLVEEECNPKTFWKFMKKVT